MNESVALNTSTSSPAAVLVGAYQHRETQLGYGRRI